MKPDSWRRFREITVKPFNKKARRIEKRTLRHANTFIVKRWENVRYVRRHILGLLFLLGLLIGLTGLQSILNQRSITHSAQQNGGAYVEGVVGPLNSLNPLFTTNSTENSISRLLFSGLFKYDEQGSLRGDLAQKLQIEDKGTRYVVTLKPHLTWQDHKPLTAKDVVFTVKTMQKVSAANNKANTWQGIKAEANGDSQVMFTLPSAYAPFASALTFAILPEHLLGKVPPESLQENDFNKHPIGSGPFQYSSLRSLDITSGKSALQLDAFSGYSGGQPRSAHFTVFVYNSLAALSGGLKAREVNAAVGLSPQNLQKLPPGEFKNVAPGLNSGVYALLRNDNPFLKDAKVRRALVLATDTKALRRGFNVKPLQGPIINPQLPKTQSIKQTSFNRIEAEKLFKKAGWKRNFQGILQKKGQQLTLKVVAIDAGSYSTILDRLQAQWAKVGVKVEKQLTDPGQIQQTVLRPRAYDVLVYELELGGDPDAYAYWHSSQSSGAGLNFTGYNSKIADDALITGRSHTDAKARDIRYATFAKQWFKDAPAVALYRSTLSYTTTRSARSLQGTENLVSPADRFADVANWTVRSGRVFDTP